MTPQDLMAEMRRVTSAHRSQEETALECYLIAINYAREQREEVTERLMGREFADRAYGREARL